MGHKYIYLVQNADDMVIEGAYAQKSDLERQYGGYIIKNNLIKRESDNEIIFRIVEILLRDSSY